MSLVPCVRCRRHVRLGENVCPFCEAGASSPRRASGYVAVAILGALAGCGEDVSPPPPPTPPPVSAPIVAAPPTAEPPPVPVGVPAPPVAEGPPPAEVATPEPPPSEEPAPTPRERLRRERPDERTIAAYGGSPSPDDPF